MSRTKYTQRVDGEGWEVKPALLPSVTIERPANAAAIIPNPPPPRADTPTHPTTMPEELPELTRRLGKFQILNEWIRTDPEAILKAFLSECIVVRAELMYETMSVHYTAMCRHFDICEPHFVPPEYLILFKKVNIGTDEDPEYETPFDHVERLP